MARKRTDMEPEAIPGNEPGTNSEAGVNAEALTDGESSGEASTGVLSAPAAATEAKRKRGRPEGSTNKKAGTVTPIRPPVSRSEPITADNIKMLLRVLGPLQVWVFFRFVGIPNDIAQQVFMYSAEEENLIAPLAAKVATKYCGNLGKYQDEILLALMVGGLLHNKLQYAMQLKEQRVQPSVEAVA